MIRPRSCVAVTAAFLLASTSVAESAEQEDSNEKTQDFAALKAFCGLQEEQQLREIHEWIEEYTDRRHGFAFYYPKTWRFESPPTGCWPRVGALVLEGYEECVYVTTYRGRKIMDSDAKFGSVGFYYDNESDAWHRVVRDWGCECPADGGPRPLGFACTIHCPAESAFHTVSGLPVFRGTGRWRTNIIALSKERFVVLNMSGSGWTDLLDPLTRTVSNTGETPDDEERKRAMVGAVCSILGRGWGLPTE